MIKNPKAIFKPGIYKVEYKVNFAIFFKPGLCKVQWSFEKKGTMHKSACTLERPSPVNLNKIRFTINNNVILNIKNFQDFGGIPVPGSESRDRNSDSHPGMEIPGLKVGFPSRDFNPGMKNRPGFPSRPGADPCFRPTATFCQFFMGHI